MRRYRELRVLAAALVVCGLLVLVPIGYYSVKNKLALSGNATAAAVKPDHLDANAITGHPQELDIPSLAIDLHVIDGIYDKKSGEWTLTLDKAQFATTTTPPNNERGNTFIYGHYRPEVFAYLHLIQPGAQAIVTTTNGYQFRYTYLNTKAFDPNDTSIFSYKGKPRLTIQTCSGAFMQHRQMYYFRFDGYKKVA